MAMRKAVMVAVACAVAVAGVAVAIALANRNDDNGFAVTKKQFAKMFPRRDAFYTYEGLTAALAAYPAFATTGTATVRKREAAAFLANVSHETGGLAQVVEQDSANYGHYCDAGKHECRDVQRRPHRVIIA